MEMFTYSFDSMIKKELETVYPCSHGHSSWLQGRVYLPPPPQLRRPGTPGCKDIVFTASSSIN